MDPTVVLGAVSATATVLSVAAQARYRHKSLAAVVNAWSARGDFDLPAAIAALNGSRAVRDRALDRVSRGRSAQPPQLDPERTVDDDNS